MKVWESPFIPSHLTFKRFRIPLTFSQSIKQSTQSICYYNIPKFRILGCYKPTTLKMNLVLEIRRGQQEIGQGLGSPQNPSIITQGLGCYHPQKHGYGSIKTHIIHRDCRSSQILGKIPSLGSSGSGITFSSILLSFPLGKVIPRLGLLS